MKSRVTSSEVIISPSLQLLISPHRDLYAGGFADRGKHEKEFPPERLRIVRELGEGAFGVVSQAEAEGIVDGEKRTDVAVKQLRDESQDFDEFFREVDFMSGLDHPNIVRLLGECTCNYWNPTA